MSNKEDYYSLLNVERDVAGADLKKAYRRLAMKYHPDRNPGDKTSEAKFKEISEAYEVLSDQQKRSLYDQYGHAGVDAGHGGGGGAHSAAGFADVFSDIFGDFFGGEGGGHGSGSNNGADLRYSLELSLEQAVDGADVKIKVPTLVKCSGCHGSGAKSGSKPINCVTCGGMGQVRMQQGFFSIQQPCPKCHGQGQTISDPCRKCRGQGRSEQTKTLSVKIPAGVDTGDRIRLSGEGEAGVQGGAAGDLYVQIEVEQHNVFERDGADLYCEKTINISSAALGDEIMVPVLKGKIKLKIPKETQTGKLFRLRGKGIKTVRGEGPGDLLCRIIVMTPTNLNREQKKLLQELGKSFQKS